MKKLIIALAAIVVLGLTGFIVPVAAQEGTPTPTPTSTPTPTPTPWLGLEVIDINAGLAQRMGVNLGVLVVKVVDGGPAAQAGMKVNDIILSAGGKPINKVADLADIVKALKVGDILELTGRRGDAPMTWRVTLGEKPQPEPTSLIPGIPELAGVPRDQLFSHLLSGQINMTDKDGNPLTIKWFAGTVATLAEGSVTVKPNDGSANVTYNTNEVKVRGKLEVGSGAIVVSVNDQARLIVAGKLGVLPRLGGNLLPARLRTVIPPVARALAHSLKGEVKAASDTGLLLAVGEREVRVVFSQDVKVRPDRASLTVGAKVLVIGKKQEDGSILASQIQVLPQTVAPRALKDRLDMLRHKIKGLRDVGPRPAPGSTAPVRLPQT